jgi:hypothetical protein
MGTTDGGVASYFQDPLPFDAHAKFSQLGYHALTARKASFTKARQRLLESSVADVHKVSKHMHFTTGDITTQFDARDQSHSWEFVYGALRLSKSSGSVVIAN